MVRFRNFVLIWAALALALNALIPAGTEYDSGWFSGLLWWLAQLFSAPVNLLAELLAKVGIDARSYIGYAIIIAVIVLIVTVGAFMSKRPAKPDNA